MLSLVEAKNDCFRNMTTQLYWEQKLWSGNKSVKNPACANGGDVGFVTWRSSSFVHDHFQFLKLS